MNITSFGWFMYALFFLYLSLVLGLLLGYIELLPLTFLVHFLLIFFVVIGRIALNEKSVKLLY